MELTADGLAKLITAVGVLLGGILLNAGRAIDWLTKRQRATTTPAVKAVATLEEALDLRKQQIEMLDAMNTRMAETISRQDVALTRKDRRIADLEALLDARYARGR